jgi:hypothetical protein
MGLDWIVKSKPKPGAENHIRCSELKEKIEELHESLEDHERNSPSATQVIEVITELREQLHRISVHPTVTAKCKIIGVDPEANEYAINKFKNVKYSDIQIEAKLEECYGQPVPHLCEDPDALAAYSGIAVSDFDFRGQALLNCPYFNFELRNEAFKDHNPEELLKYADKIELAFNNYKEVIDGTTELDEEEITKSALTWMRYWGKNGHGFEAWY